MLERIEERLFALRAAGRKYNTPVDQLAELAVRYLADLARIDAGASRLAALETEAAAAVERYTKTAAALSERRREIAERLDKAVNAELKPLRLDQARFSTAITSMRKIRGRTASTGWNFGSAPTPAPSRGRS